MRLEFFEVVFFVQNMSTTNPGFWIYHIFATKIPIVYFYLIKFIYSEKATTFCEIFTLLLTGNTKDKSKMKISQNFVALSECMNFKAGGESSIICCVRDDERRRICTSLS